MAKAKREDVYRGRVEDKARNVTAVLRAGQCCSAIQAAIGCSRVTIGRDGETGFRDPPRRPTTLSTLSLIEFLKPFHDPIPLSCPLDQHGVQRDEQPFGGLGSLGIIAHLLDPG